MRKTVHFSVSDTGEPLILTCLGQYNKGMIDFHLKSSAEKSKISLKIGKISKMSSYLSRGNNLIRLLVVF